MTFAARRSLSSRIVVLVLVSLAPAFLGAQGRRADYERADALRARFTEAAVDVPERAVWIEKTPRFWYRKSVPGGNAFVLVDAEKLSRGPAFDHERLAAALAAAAGKPVTAAKLPFSRLDFVDGEKALEFEAFDFKWRCALSDYACAKLGPAEGRGDGWQRAGGPRAQAASPEAKASPDGRREAFLRNYNVWVRMKPDPAAKDGPAAPPVPATAVAGADAKPPAPPEWPLSFEGNEGDYYTFESLAWSPDSKSLAAYRVRPGHERILQYVESSPENQLQPRYKTLEYTKPGDTLDFPRPVVFRVDAKERLPVEAGLFPNPFSMSPLEWRKDSRALTLEYNERGHQVYRVIEVDAATGRARAIVEETAKTFFCYSGKHFRHDVADGAETVWMSERDGWNHLYLYDGASGRVKNQITRGPWVVRSVDRVDDEKRQIWFQASGMTPGIDPYFVHAYRIDFDGGNLKALTEGNANHAVSPSPDLKTYMDTWSRVDEAPVMQLRAAEDGRVLMELERVDLAGLRKAGWRAPEPFVAKGRDGTTDIWGVIVKPAAFDARKKYPVIENIYAGPHASFAPKSFAAYNGMMSLAELGFVVVQMDGMGTSNRSKAFHDICWKNIGDAGFPDRILWHRAAAAKFPWYDTGRVGIYGTSAGGQNALGGLLFHPEFYKAGYASCGCHDNRMDKIWWNEQWMGWPLGPHYAASSNVDNAWRLKGKLLLVVGELDTNVDPASTMQVVNALIKANKTFDLLVIPGANHTSGGPYGERKRNDFFVRHLLGVEPPDWNAVEKK